MTEIAGSTFKGKEVRRCSGFQAAVDTPEILLLLLLPHGRINSRMTSYLKIFVLKNFPLRGVHSCLKSRIPSFLVSCRALLGRQNEVAFSASKTATRGCDSGVFEWSRAWKST